MTVRAVILPGTVLLVPGAAGRATVLTELRGQVLEALARLAGSAQRVVVLAPGGPDRRGELRPGLAAAGIDDRWLEWSDADGAVDTDGADDGTAADRPVAGVPASVGLLALRAAGWAGPIEVVEVSGDLDEGVCQGLGQSLASDDVSLVVVEGTTAGGPHDVAAPGLSRTVRAVLDAALDDRVRSAALRRDVQSSVGEYEGHVYELVSFTSP